MVTALGRNRDDDPIVGETAAGPSTAFVDPEELLPADNFARMTLDPLRTREMASDMYRRWLAGLPPVRQPPEVYADADQPERYRLHAGAYRLAAFKHITGGRMVDVAADGGRVESIRTDRNFRALFEQVEVRVVPRVDDVELDLDRVAENLQRTDPTSAEVARSICVIHERHGLSYKEIGAKLNRSRRTAANMARTWRNLCPLARTMWSKGLLSEHFSKNTLSTLKHEDQVPHLASRLGVLPSTLDPSSEVMPAAGARMVSIDIDLDEKRPKRKSPKPSAKRLLRRIESGRIKLRGRDCERTTEAVQSLLHHLVNGEPLGTMFEETPDT